MKTNAFLTLIFILACYLPSVGQQQQTVEHDTISYALVDQEPIPLNLSEIVAHISYPPKAVQAGIEGLVQVMVQVDSYGNYVNHEVVRSPHPLLSEAVNTYLPCLMFSPAVHEDMPVEAWRGIPFKFSITPMALPTQTNKTLICPEKPNKQPAIIVVE